jgi:hypothetical protein
MEAVMNYKEFLKKKTKYECLIEAANDLGMDKIGLKHNKTNITLEVVFFDGYNRPKEKPYITINGPHINGHCYSFEDAKALKELIEGFFSEEGEK